MTEIEAWTVFTQFADQQVHFLYSTMGCIDLILLVSCHVRVLKSEDSSTQVHLSSSLGALQQALASSQSAISTLRPVGLAELASNYVLKQAEVTVTNLHTSICTRLAHSICHGNAAKASGDLVAWHTNISMCTLRPHAGHYAEQAYSSTVVGAENSSRKRGWA